MAKPFTRFFVNQRVVVSGMGQYYWTGSLAGLKYPDKVVKANGIEVSTPEDLEKIVRDSALGETIVYTIDREAKEMVVAIQTMLFSFSDLVLIYGVYLVAGMVYLFLAAIVFIMKPDSDSAWAFFLTLLPLSVYNFVTFDCSSTHGGFEIIYGPVMMFFSWGAVHLSLLFPEKRRIADKYPFIQYVPYVIASALAFFLELTYPGPVFARFVFLYNLSMAIGAAALLGSILYSYLTTASAVSRQRAKIVLVGSSIAFPVPACGMLLSGFGVTLGNMQILNNFLMIPFMVFPASIAYAIAKHNLFDVDVYIKRTVGYGIMTAVVAAAYFAVQVVLRSFVLGPVLGEGAEKVYPVVFALLVVFLFNPLNRRVQSGVDKLFYRKKFDYKDTVISISNALSSVLNLEEIVRKIIRTIREEMFIDMSGMVVLEPQKPVSQAVFVSDGPSAGREDVNEVSIPNNDPLLSLVSREKKLITRYDIDEDPRYHPEKERCMKRFSAIGAIMVVPLIHQDEVKAVLAVGQKKSGHFYSREDVELISTLATQGAVAIENAKLAERMQKEEVVRTNLARYLSPQIVDRIVRHDVQVNLGGDRKVVTVLFTDIRNFTTITEGRPPDQLVHILNEYFTEMAGVIFENQGSLDKYIGDAVVAMFGSLIPLENPARNAVEAAIGMMRIMSDLNRHWEARYAFSMNIGIGVSTGEVFLGNIGSPERMEFTVIGDAVNVASRFSGLARGGQILVTKMVAESLGDAFRLAPLPPVEVKGKTGKLEVFEVFYPQPAF
jgi:adenylate cyclase